MTATLVSRSSALSAPIACGCCLLTGAAYVTAVDPSDGGVFLPCPFRAATGLWCPGCGLTRATHHLFRGDLVQALRYNLFIVLALAAIAASWLGWLRRASGRPPLWSTRIPPLAVSAAIVVLAAFAVVRNLPVGAALRG